LGETKGQRENICPFEETEKEQTLENAIFSPVRKAAGGKAEKARAAGGRAGEKDKLLR